jgi:hypothetical protein
LDLETANDLEQDPIGTLACTKISFQDVWDIAITLNMDKICT